MSFHKAPYFAIFLLVFILLGTVVIANRTLQATPEHKIDFSDFKDWYYAPSNTFTFPHPNQVLSLTDYENNPTFYSKEILREIQIPRSSICFEVNERIFSQLIFSQPPSLPKDISIYIDGEQALIYQLENSHVGCANYHPREGRHDIYMTLMKNGKEMDFYHWSFVISERILEFTYSPLDSPDFSQQQFLDTIEEFENQWNQSNLLSYKITLHRDTYTNSQIHEVTAKQNGNVYQVIGCGIFMGYRRCDKTLKDGMTYTIPNLFDLLRTQIAQGKCIEVTFNYSWGYPEKMVSSDCSESSVQNTKWIITSFENNK